INNVFKLRLMVVPLWSLFRDGSPATSNGNRRTRDNVPGLPRLIHAVRVPVFMNDFSEYDVRVVLT
ncbi:MAG TPA: hypothetical protein VNM70_07405, partial [Burkholderiales bacterium]|nr:hypothetical protein [Burkholderiales bacterium]